MFADARVPRGAAASRRSTRSTGRGWWRSRSTMSGPPCGWAARIGRSPSAVPTGNFGNVYAGRVAAAIGLPIDAAGGRHQRERHPGPLLRHPPLRARHASSPPPARPWTSRSRAISSACCSSSRAATPSARALGCRPSPRPAASRWTARLPGAVRRRQRRSGGGRGHHRRHPARDGRAGRSAHRRGLAVAARHRPPRGRADGDAGDRPPRQVPRRGRGRDRRGAAAARSATPT